MPRDEGERHRQELCPRAWPPLGHAGSSFNLQEMKSQEGHCVQEKGVVSQPVGDPLKSYLV